MPSPAKTAAAPAPNPAAGRPSPWPARLAALSLGLNLCGLALLGAGLALLLTGNLGRLLDHAPILELAKRELLSRSQEIGDSHNDPWVGFVPRPGLVRARFTGVEVWTNALGLRERPIESPKPAGRLRLVLLGDSFVFGYGVAPDERMGRYLSELLAPHLPPGLAQVECLHVGVGGWNAVNATTFLRRQLDALDPDLVLHLLIENDLDDGFGARGFGAFAKHVPLRRGRGDGRVQVTQWPFPGQGPVTNPLRCSADAESRARFTELADAIAALAAALERRGTPYLAVGYWGVFNPQLRFWLERRAGLAPEQLAFLEPNDWTAPEYVLAADDTHFSPAGHRRFARVAYHLLASRRLLAGIELPPGPHAPEAQALLERGQAAADRSHEDFLLDWLAPSHRLAFPVTRPEDFAMVYGGVDASGAVSPYAGFCLRPGGRFALSIRGRGLPGREPARVRVSVWVEKQPLGEFEVLAGQEFEARFDCPEALAAAPALSVELFSDDWRLVGRDAQRCQAFTLTELALLDP